jgi:hypothetical protein
LAIEIFHRGKRVASHRRSQRPHRPTSVPEHMPSAHRRYRDWTHERIRHEAQAVGPDAAVLVDLLGVEPYGCDLRATEIFVCARVYARPGGQCGTRHLPAGPPAGLGAVPKCARRRPVPWSYVPLKAGKAGTKQAKIDAGNV